MLYIIIIHIKINTFESFSLYRQYMYYNITKVYTRKIQKQRIKNIKKQQEKQKNEK